MNIFKEYRAYIFDNPERYWFKRKMYGFGWTPARWQGWVATVVYLGIVFGAFFLSTPSLRYVDDSELVRVLVVATILFLIIAWRTGEPPKWQWGKEPPLKENG